MLTNDTGCGGLKTSTSVTYQGTIYRFSAADPVVIALKDATGTPIGATLTISSNGAWPTVGRSLNADALGAGQKGRLQRPLRGQADGLGGAMAPLPAGRRRRYHLTGKIVGLADGLSAVTDIDGAVNAVDRKRRHRHGGRWVTAHATGGSGSVS